MFDLTTQEARLLLEIALMATGHNRFSTAGKILAGLEQFRSGEESVDCATVILALSQHSPDIALQFLNGQALVRHPDSAMLQLFQGLSLIQLQEQGQARQILQPLQQCQDANIAEMAKKLLVEL